MFIESRSSGTNLNGYKNQSLEIAKDFGKTCPGIEISIDATGIDYHIVLNHQESGFFTSNQIEIANASGVLISNAKQGGSIDSDSKKMCKVILADWAKK